MTRLRSLFNFRRKRQGGQNGSESPSSLSQLWDSGGTRSAFLLGVRHDIKYSIEPANCAGKWGTGDASIAEQWRSIRHAARAWYERLRQCSSAPDTTG